MFGGFDRDSYDAVGDAMFTAIRAETNLRWVGFYLSHDADHVGNTWTARRPTRNPEMSSWQYLRAEGWGRAPLYLGRQFLPPAVPKGPSRPNPRWSRAQGIADGNHAVDLTRLNDKGNWVDIEAGATIYLDLEADGFMVVAAGREYVAGWLDAVRARGFRPGVYCSHPSPKHGVHDGPLIQSSFPDVALWYYRIPLNQPVVYDEDRALLTLNPVDDYNDPAGNLTVPTGFIAAQFAWYNAKRSKSAANPAVQGARLKTGPTQFFTVAPIDFDAALVADPAHPEDLSAVVFSRYKLSQPVIIFVMSDYTLWSGRSGDTWGDWVGGLYKSADAPLQDLGHGRWFDTRSVGAASRGEGFVDIFGLGVDGTVWTCWCAVDAATGHDNWSGPASIGGPRTARHGSAIAAVSRQPGALDVFFFNTNHELVNAYWRTDAPNWTAQTGPITHGFSFHPASNVAPLVTPADPLRLDVFAVEWSNAVRWTQWRAAAGWQSWRIATQGVVDPALGVQVAWFGDRMHLVVGIRDGSLGHLSHPDGNPATPWTWHGTLPDPAGAAKRPMGFTVTATEHVLIVAAVAADQSLVWWGMQANAWTAPASAVENPPYSSAGRIVSHPFDADSVDLAVCDQTGNFVYHRLTSAPGEAAPGLTQTWRF